jgi:hypothetical protein
LRYRLRPMNAAGHQLFPQLDMRPTLKVGGSTAKAPNNFD